MGSSLLCSLLSPGREALSHLHMSRGWRTRVSPGVESSVPTEPSMLQRSLTPISAWRGPCGIYPHTPPLIPGFPEDLPAFLSDNLLDCGSRLQGTLLGLTSPMERGGGVPSSGWSSAPVVSPPHAGAHFSGRWLRAGSYPLQGC